MITYNGMQITEEEFESISANLDNLNIEIKASNKKSPMEKLNYRFGKGVQKECEALAEVFEVHNQSDIARSAMAIGLRELRKMIDKDLVMANGLVHIGKIRHDLFK
jgi:hypothetical protein